MAAPDGRTQVRLTDTPLALVAAGKYNSKVPVMMGSNRDESAYWTIAEVSNTQTELGFDAEMYGNFATAL